MRKVMRFKTLTSPVLGWLFHTRFVSRISIREYGRINRSRRDKYRFDYVIRFITFFAKTG